MKQERCAVCGETFDPHQVRQKYCSHACQMRAFRARETSRRHTGTRETSRGAAASVERTFWDEKGVLVDEDGMPLTRIGDRIRSATFN